MVIINEKLARAGAMDEATLVECLLGAVEGNPLLKTAQNGSSTGLNPVRSEETGGFDIVPRPILEVRGASGQPPGIPAN